MLLKTPFVFCSVVSYQTYDLSAPDTSFLSVFLSEP